MSIYTLLERLEFLRGQPAALLVILAAAVAVAAWDMRLVLPALAGQYFGSFLLYVDVLDPRLAVVYTLTGLFTTLIMTVTAAQVNWGRVPPNLTAAERTELNLPPSRKVGPFSLTAPRALRLTLAIGVAAAVIVAGRSSALPQVGTLPAHVQLAVAGLLALGLVGMATGGPLYSGVGLLLFLNGFNLLVSSFEQSFPIVVALSAANLLVAVVIGYLAQARFRPPASVAQS